MSVRVSTKNHPFSWGATTYYISKAGHVDVAIQFKVGLRENSDAQLESYP